MFKEIDYNIDLTPAETINKIKSITSSSKKELVNKDEFIGKHINNSFEIRLKPPCTILLRNSFNPNFHGNAVAVDDYTKLSIIMRPTATTYICPVMLIIFLIAGILVFIYKNDFHFLIVSIMMFLGFTIAILGSLYMKYSNMKYIIETLFKNKIL